MNKIITFIGAGNMSRALISGLVQDRSDLQIRVSDPNEAQLNKLKQRYSSIETYTNNSKAIIDSDVVVLAVKPQVMKTVCEPLLQGIKNKNPLVISVAAGVSIANLQLWLGEQTLPIIRCMPNTPALVQSGMTGLFASSQVTAVQHDFAENILRAVGSILWLSTEDKMDAVTAISGSGPAYYFLVMESMQAAAQSIGLTVEESRLLVLQTAFGAAKLALESEDDAGALRQRVTSKGGTTEAALNVLIEGGLPELFNDALKSAENRSIELKNS